MPPSCLPYQVGSAGEVQLREAKLERRGGAAAAAALGDEYAEADEDFANFAIEIRWVHSPFLL